MAGDWIKMEHCLPRKPEVFRLASILKLDRFAVVGRLHVLWSWADEQSVSGQGLNLTYVSLDAVVGLTGFAAALQEVGWLTGVDGNINFPNFDRHNGETAKARALNRKHKAASRVRLMSGSKPDQTLTREEKRREENNTLPPTPVPDQPGHVRDSSGTTGTRMRENGKPRSVEDVVTQGARVGVSEPDCRAWFTDMEASGWAKVDGTPFANWPRELCMHRDRLRERRSKDPDFGKPKDPHKTAAGGDTYFASVMREVKAVCQPSTKPQ